MKSQLVIFCGGKGTRLGELTQLTPKPMLPFGGKPFLNYLLRSLCRLPFDEVILLAGHLGDTILETFEGQEINGVKIKVVIEKSPNGTFNALRTISSVLEDEFWIANGDTFISFDKHVLLSDIFKGNYYPGKNLIFSAYVDNGDRYGALIQDGCNRLISFKEKDNCKNPKLINSGFLRIFKKDILRETNVSNNSIELDLIPNLISEKSIIVVNDVIQCFIDFGVPEAYDQLPSVLTSYFAKPVIIWDRDGTINVDHGYTHRVSDLVITKTVQSLLKMGDFTDKLNFIVTNQSGIARGLFSIEDFLSFHKALKIELLSNKMWVDDIRFCPHHPDGVVGELSKHCECRKPGVGMYLQLLNSWGVDAVNCVAIGNSHGDAEAALRLNIPFFQVDQGVDLHEPLKEFIDDHI